MFGVDHEPAAAARLAEIRLRRQKPVYMDDWQRLYAIAAVQYESASALNDAVKNWAADLVQQRREQAEAHIAANPVDPNNPIGWVNNFRETVRRNIRGY